MPPEEPGVAVLVRLFARQVHTRTLMFYAFPLARSHIITPSVCTLFLYFRIKTRNICERAAALGLVRDSNFTGIDLGLNNFGVLSLDLNTY
jgi:hypothetical protein